MTLKTAIAKSKRRFVLVQFNVSDTFQLPVSRKQASLAFEDYLSAKDEFDKGIFEENNIYAHYEEETRTLWLG
tara:strand:- start:570 stop:788 length:219 start_codon:yes stop_codon:yes gene_type:complete